MPRTRTLIVAICLFTSLLSLRSSAQLHNEQAYIAELKFRLALLEQRWDDALAHCSPELNRTAKKYASAQKFFEDTTPLKALCAKDLGARGFGNSISYNVLVFWVPPEKRNKQKEVVQVSKHDSKGPSLREIWQLGQRRATPDSAWLFYWKPVPLDHLFEDRMQLRAEWKARTEKFHKGMQKKFEQVELQLSSDGKADKQTFKLGAPIRVRVEVANSSKEAVHFVDHAEVGPQTHSFTLKNVAGQPVTRKRKPPMPPAQYGVQGQRILKGGETVHLYTIDFHREFEITEPGTYTLRSSGNNISFGDQIVFKKNDRHRNDGLWLYQSSRPGFSRHGFVPLGKSIASNTLQIEVK